MDKFVVHQSKLSGKVSLSGSKNAALPIMAATILTDEDCIIHNVPDLRDIRTMARILEVLGKSVSFDKNTLVIKPKKNKSFVAPYRLVRTMRGAISSGAASATCTAARARSRTRIGFSL